jgi:hypothetical protein
MKKERVEFYYTCYIEGRITHSLTPFSCCFGPHSPKQPSVPDDVDNAWAQEYAEYCAEKEETARIMAGEPQHLSRVVVPGAVQEEESWEAQYAAYCAEKETRLRQIDQENLTHGDRRD